MELSPTTLVLIGLLLAAWTLGAAWLVLGARGMQRRAENARRNAGRLGRMIEDSPAVPLLVRADGRIEAPDRLAAWLGPDRTPGFLSELTAPGKGLTEFQLAELTDAVRRSQKTAAPFRMVVTPQGSSRSLALRGHLADSQVAPGGAALVWWFDFSESEHELTRMRDETE